METSKKGGGNEALPHQKGFEGDTIDMKYQKVLDEATRATLPGEFVELTDGVVHYEISGKEDGPWVVLVHGLITHMFAWEPLSRDLVEAGFRVLRFDLFGRGFSDRPDVDYTQDLFGRQLRGLLQALDIEGPIRLVGWSMGGLICTDFADSHPDRVSKMALIGPAFFLKLHFLRALMLRSPLFPMILKVNGEKFVLKNLRGHFSRADVCPEYYEGVREQMEYPGFFPSLLSTIRHLPFDAGKEFGAVGRHPRPVLLIWGDKDEVTPYTDSTKVRNLFVTSDFFPVKNAGHAPHVEYPDVVNAKIVSFLAK